LLEDTQPFEVGKHIIGTKVGWVGWIEVEKFNEGWKEGRLNFLEGNIWLFVMVVALCMEKY